MLSLPPPLNQCCWEGLRIHQVVFGGKATLIRGRRGKICCGKWFSRPKFSFIPKRLNSFVRDCSSSINEGLILRFSNSLWWPLCLISTHLNSKGSVLLPHWLSTTRSFATIIITFSLLHTLLMAQTSTMACFVDFTLFPMFFSCFHNLHCLLHSVVKPQNHFHDGSSSF